MIKNKNMKVYEVSFGTFNTKEGDYLNVDSKTIVAVDAQEAIENAMSMLDKKEQEDYYVYDVSLVTELS